MSNYVHPLGLGQYPNKAENGAYFYGGGDSGHIVDIFPAFVGQINSNCLILILVQSGKVYTVIQLNRLQRNTDYSWR